MRDLIRTIKYASKYRFLAISVIVLGIVNTTVHLLEPFILKLFFDLAEKSIKTGLNETVYSEFYRYVALFVLLAFSGIMVNRLFMYTWTLWSNKTESYLAVKGFNKLESLSLDYFTKNQTGKLTEQLSGGIGAIVSIMESVGINLLTQVYFLVAAMTILMISNYSFGLIIFLGIFLYIVVSFAFNKKLIPLHDEIRNKSEDISSIRTETITNIKTVKSYAQEERQAKSHEKLNEEMVSLNTRWIKTANTMYALRGTIDYSAQIVAVSLGFYMVLRGEISLGTLILIYSYVQKSFEPMWYLSRLYDSTVKNMRKAKRYFDILETESNVIDLPNAKSLRIKEGMISINNLKFSYSDGDGKKVIKGISLEIPAKKTVAIVGKSGSGKTTLAKLLMRFHDPVGGEIQIDGFDIKKITQKSLRENIAYVLQDSLLFNDTVLNNIKFGKPKAKDDEVVGAARIANADEFVDKLPKKYNTVVGERGVKLSGGEQQRINIARAVLKNAPILILDEATSSLDSESELAIQGALNELIKDKTTIIIAHRLSTVMKADMIVVMDKGKIVETGTHQDLVEQKGIYSKLFEIQSGGYLDTIDQELEGAIAK